MTARPSDDQSPDAGGRGEMITLASKHNGAGASPGRGVSPPRGRASKPWTGFDPPRGAINFMAEIESSTPE
jgi:hypothetical protein